MRGPLKREFTVFWLGWLATVVSLEIVGIPDRWWLVPLLVFGVAEVWSLTVEKAATFSAHVWWWVGGGDDVAEVGRALQSVTLAAWFGWRFYSVTPRGVGPGLWAAGLTVWLSYHFYTLGEAG